MAPFIPAAFAALTSAGSAVASGVGAIGTAVGAGASSLSLGSVFSTILSGGATALTAVAAINQGQQQAAAYNAEASQADFDQQQATIDGRNRRDSMRKDLIKQLGEQDVATAASGLDLSFGTPAIARDEAKEDSASALSTDLDNETAQRNRLQQRAASLRAMAQDAKSASMLKALGAGLSFGVDALKRG